ncbi:uncharacterized protein LOC143285484 [Babylonia areolata]|uniref:uncharacterized protein LOC143285484 n=1 Tax=Babylonia areolata TaxID=304850 RepID=UPI003FD119E7
MASTEKRDFSNAAYPPPGQPQGYPPQQYGVGPPPQGGPIPPPAYVTQPGYVGGPVIVTTQPVRETGTPPDTTCSLIVSILSIFFCLGAWPFAIAAIVFNRKAKGQVDLGQYTTAQRTLRTCFIFIAVTVILGIIAWIIFGIRLKAALDYIDRSRNSYNNNRYYG